MNYIAKKEFVARNGSKIFHPGDTCITTVDGPFTKMLLKHGFIEPVKEAQPLEPGDEYYTPFRDLSGTLSTNWDGDLFDSDIFGQGLAFKTEAEAKKMAEWLKAVKVLRQESQKSMAGRKLRLMNDAYYVWQNLSHLQVVSLLNSAQEGSSLYNPFPFYDRDDAQASIEQHRAEWLTFFGGFVDED